MKTILSAYWPSIYKYRWLGLLMTVLMVVSILTKSVYPFLLRELMDALSGDPTSSAVAVTRTVWMIGLALLVHNIMWMFYDPCIVYFETLVMRDLERRSFGIIQAQSMRFFENSFAGSLVTAAKRFRSSFEGIADAFVFQLGRSMVMIVLTLIIFAWERPWLGVIFSIWAAAYCYLSYQFARMRMKRDENVATADSIMGGAFADSFANQATVKSFGKERDEQRRFDAVTHDTYRARKSAWLFGGVTNRIQGLNVSVFEILVIIFLVQGWNNGTISAGDFVFYQTYVLLLIHQIWDVGNVINRVFRHMADAKEMAAVFTEEQEVQDAPGARSLIVEEGEIEFHGVNFSYIDRETREQHDVNDFTLKIPAGQSVALVGHSGAGKSTLIKLLFRYFDLHSGYIRIDRQDIANATQESVRQQIALVPQQPELFHRSIRDNIAFARPDATEEEIIVAAKRAFAWNFIQRLPGGLDTLVGERGIKLSGGERQRIALARAFLADAPILILDEATSALDSKTEKEIQYAIADLLEGRTCIVIAHRLSTIQRADKIIVMENGSIVEQGTHDELLTRNGVYADLWEHQSGGYIK